jgi:hypothetical protein
MVNPAAVSAAVNVANFVINQNVNPETDSAMLTKIEDYSKSNSVLGVPSHEGLIADSPMIKCLQETAGAGNGTNFCAPGIAYVFYERRSQGKSSAVRYFCRKDCKKNGRRSLHIGASSAAAGDEATTYFQRVAADLDVDFTSNWARCLVDAMSKAPNEKLSPFLFLDEFNDGSTVDLQNLNGFMRACQSLGFYLIIVTSDQKIADNVMSLNAWEKMRPLKYIHNGPTENIEGQPGYEENKTANWKKRDWTHEQLKKVVIEREGEFGDYSFILPKSTPTDALIRARQINEMQGVVLPNASSLSAEECPEQGIGWCCFA